MATGGSETKEVTFSFRKRTDGSIDVVSYKEAGYVEDRLIDVDLRDISAHPALNIQEIKDILATVASSKKLVVKLSPANYEDYSKGVYTVMYDRRATETTRSTTSAIATTTTTTANSSIPPAADLTQLIHIMAQQQENQMRMMTDITAALGNMATFSRTKKMDITKFDGVNSDARSWLLLFERACETNGWLTDSQKVNNLKASLVPLSGADRWYLSKILQEQELSWLDWKESFIAAFTQNRIESSKKALGWEYRNGSVMSYFYEKERLLQIAFPHIHVNTLVTLVILGLPSYIHPQVLAFKPDDKDELIDALQTLVPKSAGKDGSDSGKHKRSDDRPKFVPHDSYKPRGQAFQAKPKHQQTPPQSVPKRVNNVGRHLPTHQIEVNGVLLTALLDSGSECDLISANVVNQHGWETSQETNPLQGFDTSVTSPKSKVAVTLTMKAGDFLPRNFSDIIDAVVVDNLHYDMLIGMDTLKTMGIGLAFVGNVATGKIKSIDDVREHFPEVLNERREPKVEVEFKLRDPTLISAKKPYRLSRDKTAKVMADVEEQLRNGWLVHSTSSFAAPIVAVSKADKPIRTCQDYREVNLNTDLDPFPMPLIDDIIVNLGGCEWFTKIDLKDAFRQIGLTKETRQYTAFVTGTGHHLEHTRLPFGWKNSPPIFQRHITRVLGDLLNDPRVSVYVDDIVCGSKTKDENDELTYKIIQRLDEHGMIISAKKSEFSQRSVVLLGRVIDGQSRTTRVESIEKVRNMHRPIDVKTVQQFTGLTNHFRDFIPDYASIVRPIDRLKRKDEPFLWSSECEAAFQKLVTIITSDPILSLPDWSLEFELTTDASNYGCGGILYQRNSNNPKKKQLRVVGYYSHTFTPAECNYNVSEKEMLAVIKAIKYFRSYLEGRKFKVHSDHQALASIMSLKEPKGRLARWQLFLMSYDMEINHRRGTELRDADAISRLCLDKKPIVCAVLRAKPLLSPEDKQMILKRYHDDPDSGGHDGIMRTYYKLKTRFGKQWPALKKDIEHHVRTCHICQISKFKFRPKADYLVLAPHSSLPYEVVHLDYGELSKKKEGCKTTRSFILLVDEFTRMVHTKAIRQTARGLISFLESLPFLSNIKRIVSDNGPSFVSKELGQWAKDKFKLTFTAPYHPAANGLAESKVKDIKAFIKRYPNFPGGWKACLTAANNHINRSYHASIGCTPYFMAHHRSDLFPADKEFGISEVDEEKPLSSEKVRSRRLNAQAAVNKNKKKPQFDEGDEILYHRADKHLAEGPVTVNKVIMKEGVPKTLLVDDGTGEKAVAVKNAIRYNRRSKMSLLSLAVILFALLPLSTLAQLIRESPLLWEPTSMSVNGGYYTYHHKIVLADPCSKLDVIDMVHSMRDKHKEELAEWCRLKLKLDFWDRIKTICSREDSEMYEAQKRKRSDRTDNTTKRPKKVRNLVEQYRDLMQNKKITRVVTRRKRFPILIAIATVALLTAVVGLAFGIATSAWLNSKENKQEIIQHEQKLNKLREENLKHKEALEILTRDVLNITRRLEELKSDFEGVVAVLPLFATTIADVGDKLAEIKRMTREVVRSWRLPSRKLSPSFFELFNVTSNNLQPNSITDNAEANHCSYTESEGYLEFTYYVPVSKPGAKILKAHPFVLYHDFTLPSSNVTVNCKFLYDGPAYALTGDGCIYPLEKTDIPDSLSAYLYEQRPACLDEPQAAEARFKPNECDTSFTKTTQIRFTPLRTFIYCPDRYIYLENHNITCPNYVFSLPRSKGFKIGNFTYEVNAHIINQLNFSLIDNLLVGHMIYPAAGHEDFGLAPGLEELLKELDKPSLGMDWSWHPTSYWLVAGTATLLTVSVGSLLFCISKRGARKVNRSVRHTEEQTFPLKPMRSVVARTSDSPD